MAIDRLLEVGTFDPEMIACMTAAYEGALRVLGLADRQDPITELVAKKIIKVTQLGERDPARICERALNELGVTRPDLPPLPARPPIPFERDEQRLLTTTCRSRERLPWLVLISKYIAGSEGGCGSNLKRRSKAGRRSPAMGGRL
jgi:hypothetical protein